MAKYLDPKNDLTFKRIFGEHKHLCMSLLNNLLKFEGDEKIVSLEYCSPELVPEFGDLKYSIVDVKCVDCKERMFIVEMQMYWSKSFRARALLNAAKAYSRQLDGPMTYNKLHPVFSLCLVNDIIEPDKEFADKYYWEYGIREKAHHDKHIPGFDFVFIELPKYVPVDSPEKDMFDLWLELLTQVDESKDEIPGCLLSNAETAEAIRYLQEVAYTRGQMYAYDKFRDAHMIEATRFEDAWEKGEAKGMEKGMAKGIEKGRAEANIENAKKMKGLKIPVEQIAEITGLSVEEIEKM